ncbi:Putative ribonuclease H protein At1g65750, partial [Linum perenne]
ITSILGINATQDLGRYLGVPILHGKVTNHTYSYLLDHLDSKLAGWKADNLSLAGIFTLASSVLNFVPSYAMQTAYLPVGLCDKIDRKIRNFIWGSTDATHKIHNVNWQTVCKPKKLGGLGLRSAREHNKAFLMKIVWGLIARPDELWAKVILNKYLDTTGHGFILKRKIGYSAVWRGILNAWNDTLKGVQWSIQDGTRTRFWSDVLLDSDITLIDHALDSKGINPSASVLYFCSSNGVWDIRKLESCLPIDIVLQIGGMTPPRQEAGSDMLIWGLEHNGRFTIRSAYDLLKVHRLEDQNNSWQKIWSWKGPNKIRHFM